MTGMSKIVGRSFIQKTLKESFIFFLEEKAFLVENFLK